jgi:two-component system LytT family response regulator
MCVHAGNDTHVLRSTLSDLLRQLDPRRFRRIHRSTIVNLDYVRELRSHPNGEAVLTLREGQQLKLSRRYRDQLRLR